MKNSLDVNSGHFTGIYSAKVNNETKMVATQRSLALHSHISMATTMVTDDSSVSTDHTPTSSQHTLPEVSTNSNLVWPDLVL